MGGNQSTGGAAAVNQNKGVVSSSSFQYTCDSHVSQFISNRPAHLLQLKKNIEDYAELENIVAGQVQLTAKLNATSTAQDDCQKKLDEFFNSYLSFEEKLDRTMSSYELDFILNSKGFNCDTVKSPYGNTVRITGVSSDVKSLIYILRDYQNPSTLPDTTAPNVKSDTTLVKRTDNSSTFNSNVQNPSNEFADAGSTNNHDQYGISSGGSIIAIQQMQGDSNARSPPTVSHEFGNDSKMPNTSSFTSSVSSADSIEDNSPTFPQTRLILPTSHQFIFTPADFSVARFIKYSREHTQHLKDAFSSLANAEVLEQKSVKKVEYRFRPVQGQQMTKQEFDYRCTKRLSKFLENYSSRKRRFNRDRLDKVAEEAPYFFENMSGRDNGELHVQWYCSDYLVILSGLKHKVEEKEAEIIQFFDEMAPRKSMKQSSRSVSTRFVFKLPAHDFSVARFLQQSRRNFTKLEIITRDFATIKLWNIFDKNDKAGNARDIKKKKEIEYHFRPIANCELSEEEFRLKCQSTLEDFLDLYSSAKKFFNHEHLMKAMTKDPEFFKKQSSHERELLYVEWRIDRNKVLLTGLKCDVDSKIEEITTHLDALVPKTLKELYEFDMDPPSLILARFIKESNFHLNSLRGSLENARLWITPGSLKLHFKATIQLEQHSIPMFEDECKNIATKFFRKFFVWKPRYPSPVVKATVRSNPELFGFHVTNCMCEVSDQNEIILVGLRPVASKKQSEIQKALDKNDAIIKAKKKTRGSKRSPSVEPVADDAFADHADKLRPFLYEPKAKANLNVLKHVFQNPLAVNDLQQKVGLLIGFEPFPNPIEPLGLRFFPTLGASIDVEYYTKDMPASVAEFFGRFLLCRSRCEPHQEKNILDAVYFCGQKYNVPERGISIHKENGFVNVVGPRRVIAELVKMIDGTKCEGTRVHLHQLPGSSRKLSTSSNKSQPASNKNKKTPNKSSSVAPKPQNEKLNTIVYNPKKQYVPQFKFTWDNHRFREELKSRFSDFCDLDGTNEKLQIVQKTEEVDRSTFAKVVVQKMEEFFDSISIDLLSLDADVMQYFKENEEDWLKNHYDPKDWILISWKENGIEMKGFKNDVLKYKSIIESQLEDTETVIKATSEITNVLNVCGVIAETNRQLGGKVVVSCTPGADTVSFKGRRCFHESAQAKLAEMGLLVEKAPITSPQKLKVLASIKEKNGEGIQLIEKKMAEKNIKCVLLLQSGKVILTAMTEEMFSKGSKFLDQLIRSVDIPKQDGVPANTFKGKAWNNLVSKLTASNTVFVSLQNSYITLSAFDQDTLSDAAAEVKKFFDALLIKTREIQCQGHVTRFVMTFHSRKGLTLTQTKSGLQIDGSAKDVDKFVEKLKGITWSRCQLSYTAPVLASYFNSSNWKNFIKILEQEVRCTIYCDLSKCKHQSDGEEEIINSPSTSQSRDSFDINNVQVASYGGVMVSVRHGDICDDNSDAIVNGVISTEFNLSRGAVSSSLLRRAGRNLQHECDAADKSSPVIRHTRGCNLRCSHVIHVVTPNQPDVLTQRLKDVLDHAELLRAKSVALPTLGAGGIGLQSSDVASSMSKAFELFAHSKPRFVRNIKVVVYDLPIVTMFQTTIVQSKELMDFGKRAIEASESKYKSLLGDEVTVHINCDDSTNMQQAKTRIEQHMTNIIISKTIKVESFSDLDDHDRSDIYEAAVKHKARVVFNSLSSEIMLKGLQANVNQLYDVTREMMYELREATTMSKMLVWKWGASSGLFTALPLRVSRALERKYEKSKSGSHHVTMYGSYFLVDFTKMTYDFKTITGQLKREDSEKIPPSWKDMMGKPWLKVPLDRSSPEYNRVLKVFEASNPQHTRIVNIERIQNPSLYKQYLIKKNEVQRHMRSKEPVERELFHGTSAADAEKICADNFDRSFSGKNATVYGKGCYFAVQSSYSVRYASTQLNTLSCVFLAQVLTGDFCKGDSSMISPPDKLSSGDISRKYDSVVDNQSSPTIFVVFKDTSVYPAYLITFI